MDFFDELEATLIDKQELVLADETDASKLKYDLAMPVIYSKNAEYRKEVMRCFDIFIRAQVGLEDIVDSSDLVSFLPDGVRLAVFCNMDFKRPQEIRRLFCNLDKFYKYWKDEPDPYEHTQIALIKDREIYDLRDSYYRWNDNEFKSAWRGFAERYGFTAKETKKARHRSCARIVKMYIKKSLKMLKHFVYF